MARLQQARVGAPVARATEEHVARTSGVRIGRAALPAACGELVQGTLDGVRCLVSCPIDRYAVAEVALGAEPAADCGQGNGSRHWDVPAGTPKAVEALRVGLRQARAELREPVARVRLRIASELPCGRGYASSTADVGATLYALGRALGRPMAPEAVARLAVSIEPSDSTVFPGLALFDHRTGSVHQRLGPAPPLEVVVIDPGGEVDTLAFNRLDHRGVLERLAASHREAFRLLFEGLKTGDGHAVGEAATLSARVHQAILPNPLLEPVLELAREVEALGVCRAHSGTLLGLLFDPARSDVPAALDFLVDRLPREVTLARHGLRDGGPRGEPSERQASSNLSAL